MTTFLLKERKRLIKEGRFEEFKEWYTKKFINNNQPERLMGLKDQRRANCIRDFDKLSKSAQGIIKAIKQDPDSKIRRGEF